MRICCASKGKPLIEYRYEDVRTLYDVLHKGLEVSCDGPCLGKRDGPGKGPYRWIKYSEVLDKVQCIGSGIINKGIKSSNQTNIGIYSANRPEVNIYHILKLCDLTAYRIVVSIINSG